VAKEMVPEEELPGSMTAWLHGSEDLAAVARRSNCSHAMATATATAMATTLNVFTPCPTS